MDEHKKNTLDFFHAYKWIKENLPQLSKVSGGVSNVEFSFQGNDPVREAMHAAFFIMQFMGWIWDCQSHDVEIYDDIKRSFR
jgi:5-methyltetrahydrofolate--homocysteine methyltransferase